MAIVNKRWPTDLAPESCTFSRSRNDILQRSPRSRQTSVIVTGRPLWGAQLSWSFPNGAKLAKLRRWLERLEGFKGSVQLWDFTAPRPGGVTPPAHWASGATVTLGWAAAAGHTFVTLAGCTASALIAYAGQYVQLGRRLYLAAEDCTATAGGLATLYLQTPLIEALPYGTVVRLNEAACEMQLLVQETDTSSRAGEGLIQISATFGETVVDFDEPEGTWFDFMSRRVTINGAYQGTPADVLTVSRASSAAYVDSDGVMKFATSNVLRYDYDPVTFAPRGALVESAATNLQIRSQEIDNVAWFKAGASVSANAVAAPDGTMTADKLVEDSSTGAHAVLMFGSAVMAANTKHTASVMLKAAGRSRVRMYFVTVGYGSGMFVDVDLATGLTVGSATAVGTATGVAVRIVAMPLGFWRVELTCVLDASSTTCTFQMSLMNGAADSYLGDGTSGVYVWGAQIEAGAYATSYIPTTTASAARAADAVSVLLSAITYDAAQGTIYAEASRAYPPAAATYPMLACVDDGTLNNRIQIGYNGDVVDVRAEIVASGVSGAAVSLLSPVTAGLKIKAAVAWLGTTDFTGVANAGAAQVDSTYAFPSVTTMRIGSVSAGFQTNGHLHRVSLIPRRMTNIELQEMTA